MRFKLILIASISLNMIFCAPTQKKIEEASKKNPRYQYSLGSFYLNGGNVDEAIGYFNKSISIDPNYYLAFNGLGLAYSMKGKFEESVKYFQKCLAINPVFSEARNNLGIVYQEMGLVDKAENEFKIAAAAENYNSKELPYYNLARLYFRQEKLQEALIYIQKALEVDSSMAMAYNLKGLVLEKLNDFGEAIKSYEKALEIIPEDLNLNFNLAVAYFKNNEFKKAKEIFENIFTKTTDPKMKEKIQEYLKIINKGSSLN